ncbi:Nn.00g005740.m01.CDS01 [Neocucurbitaria sp. VM-36]
MDSNDSDKPLTELEDGPVPRKTLSLDVNAVSRPPISATDEESEDGSLFEVPGGQCKSDLSPLCVHCQYICDNWLKGVNDEDFAFPHYGDVFQLEESVAAGCAMCAQFLQSRSRDEVRRAKDERTQHGPASFGTGVSFSILNKHLVRDLLTLDLSFLLPPSSDMESDLEDDFAREIILFHVDVIPTNPSGSISNVDVHPKQNTKCALPLVSHWLRKCRKAHWQCSFRSEHFTPSRLVSTDENCVRVLLQNDIQSNPEYATLSHCWGQTHFVTLNRHNLDSFREAIPEEALPQTFKDAIVTARELGLLYIWIDSLCILQDDTEDWLREAANMSSVYGASSLNIPASGAPDGNFGCFFQRENTLQCQIQVDSGRSAVRYRCVPSGMYYSSLSEMPLMDRGWTLQERLLPSRTVHFTSTQAFWECYQKVACEIFPDQFPLSLAYANSYLQKQPVSRSMWSWIVERYTSSDLTYAADKLVAISGLARDIQIQTRDQYVAGIWRKDLEFQLCWYNSIGQQCKRVAPYRAPTWSWASLDCLIDCSIAERLKYTRANTVLWIEVLDVQLQFAGADALGQLSSASLRLGCTRLLHVTLQFEVETDYMTVANKKFEALVSVDQGNATKVHEAVALPIFGSSDSGRILGLFLEPTTQQKGQYRRLGIFDLYKSKHCKAFEAASSDRSCWVEGSGLLRIRTDKFGKTHRIITLV